MADLDKVLSDAKELAQDAGEVAKNIAGEITDKAKKLTEEGSEARRIAESAKNQAASVTSGVRDKVQGIVKDAKAGSEISHGIEQLEALPEVEGSIVYRMELETTINSLKGLYLSIGDRRLDDASVEEEIREVIDKVKPAEVSGAAEDAGDQGAAGPAENTEAAESAADPWAEVSEEQRAICEVKAIAYDACVKALAALGISAQI